MRNDPPRTSTREAVTAIAGSPYRGVAFDDELLDEALRVGGHRTKEVTEALREYVQKRRQARVVDLFGKVDFDRTYDHKRDRRRS